MKRLFIANKQCPSWDLLSKANTWILLPRFYYRWKCKKLT